MSTLHSPAPGKLHLLRPLSLASAGKASWYEILRSRIRRWIGRTLTRVGAPGAIRNIEIFDELTHQRVEVSVSGSYTRIRVNGRDFYFDRITGRYDGAGSATT
jgi:hypothetical protein